MRQEAAAIFLVMLALASAMAVTSSSSIPTTGLPTRSRFLASLGPKNKKCTKDPSVCTLYPDSPGPTCCGDSCVNTQTDTLNCGKCGKICKFTESCCGGKCVDLNHDQRNCGGCNVLCKNRCFYGMCNYA